LQEKLHQPWFKSLLFLYFVDFPAVNLADICDESIINYGTNLPQSIHHVFRGASQALFTVMLDSGD